MSIRRRRSQAQPKEERLGNYFLEDKPLEFVSSGSTLLDCVLGGGYPVGRIVNIVGDKSTGKTLLAIEAIINFLRKYPGANAYYHEAESAFDKGYAQALGLPIEKVIFTTDDLEDDKNDGTMEFLFETMLYIIKNFGGEPGILVVDSLDSLSTRAEKKRSIDEGSYKMDKAKTSSEIFRRLTMEIARTNLLFIIISQVRDNIGVTFGKKYTRTGGKALDFYTSQVLWLSEIGKIPRTKNKVKRDVGVMIKAKCEKNKISLPFRECQFPIMFGYGIDDVTACLEWLDDVGALDDLDIKASNIAKESERIKAEGDTRARAKISRLVKLKWKEIETGFLPDYKKY